MALEPLSAWTARLLQNPQVDNPSDGAWNLANFYGDKADFVQAGPTGAVGIFTFNRSLFVSELLASGFGPVADTSWAGRVADAWKNAVAGSAIAANTVIDPAWIISVTDNLTAGNGAAVIISLIAARDFLENALINVGNQYINSNITNESENTVQVSAFAKAWRDATLEFVFECIGTIPPPPTPLPLTFPAL